MTPLDVQRLLDLDDAVQERLEAYAALLVKWQARINLVAPATLPDLWSRHIHDSGQLLARMAGLPGPVVHLGAGAGFPGLVLAIMGRGDVVLVEADQRKAAFLREAARVTRTLDQIDQITGSVASEREDIAAMINNARSASE